MKKNKTLTDKILSVLFTILMCCLYTVTIITFVLFACRVIFGESFEKDLFDVFAISGLSMIFITMGRKLIKAEDETWGEE